MYKVLASGVYTCPWKVWQEKFWCARGPKSDNVLQAAGTKVMAYPRTLLDAPGRSGTPCPGRRRSKSSLAIFRIDWCEPAGSIVNGAGPSAMVDPSKRRMSPPKNVFLPSSSSPMLQGYGRGYGCR
jgi:hypothetical protein